MAAPSPAPPFEEGRPALGGTCQTFGVSGVLLSMSIPPEGTREADDRTPGELPDQPPDDPIKGEVDELIDLLSQLHDQTRALAEILGKIGEGTDPQLTPSPTPPNKEGNS